MYKNLRERVRVCVCMYLHLLLRTFGWAVTQLGMYKMVAGCDEMK